MWKPKDRMWLSCGPGRNHWAYGIARFSDGSFRIVEELFDEGFSGVGQICNFKTDKNDIPCRLFPGERKMIIKDLYLACCKELKIKPEKIDG